MPPSAHGRIFYNEDSSGFNFIREKDERVGGGEARAKNGRFGNAPALAVQSASIPECLPGFAAENVLELVDAAVTPRIWIGNAVVTPAHFDESSNIACVVAGRRRFTLFAPEQIANLYIGPLGNAPTGTPISLVSFREPDHERFPQVSRGARACAGRRDGAGRRDLHPGALVAPRGVARAAPTYAGELLVEGRSGQAGGAAFGALDSLLHAILGLRTLAPGEREAWRAIFDYYVFGEGDAASSHIPEAQGRSATCRRSCANR